MAPQTVDPSQVQGAPIQVDPSEVQVDPSQVTRAVQTPDQMAQQLYGAGSFAELSPERQADISAKINAQNVAQRQGQTTDRQRIELYQPPEGGVTFGAGAQRLGKGWWDYSLGGVWGLAKGLASLVSQTQEGARVIHPDSEAARMISGMIEASADQARKAKEAWEKGRGIEAFGHAMGTLPMIGPGAANIAETFTGSEPVYDKYGNVVTRGREPDPEQGIGQILGLLTSLGFGELGRRGEPPPGGPRGGPPPGPPGLPPGGPPGPPAPPPGGPPGPPPGFPGGPAAPAGLSAADIAARRVIEAGRQYQIPLTAGDISQHPTLKNIDISLEKVPGAGMQTLRGRQQAAAVAAAKGIEETYQQKLANTAPSAIEDLRNAAEAGDQRARNVLEKVEGAGTDPDRITQASIGLGDWTTRQTANVLYDRVEKLAQEHNLGDVPMQSTVMAANRSLQQLMPAKLKNLEVIKKIQDVKKSLIPEVDEEGNVTKPVDNSYGLIRQLHSDLGDYIRSYYEGPNALIGEKGVGYLERVQNAIEDDLRNYARNSGVPEIVEAGRTADQYYKTARVPYKGGQLAQAAVSIEPDQIFQQFVKAGREDKAQNFYDALDQKGRAAVRYNMVKKAVQDATNDLSGIFSPQKFASNMRKLEEPYGVFFRGADKFEMDGFKNLMQHIVRAGQYMENPPTGQRVIPYLLAAAGGNLAVAHPWTLAALTGMVAGARGLFTTVGGRNLLLRMAGLKPGSALMDSFWRDKVAPAIADMAGQGRREPPTGGSTPTGGETPPEKPPEGGGEPPSSPPKEGGGGGGAAAAPTSFTTSQGSTYSINGESTTRTKSLHKFHDPTDIGEKPPSARTVYVSPEFAQEVGMWNTLSSTGKRIILSKDGKVQLISRGPGGKPGLDRIINDNSFSTTPEVGRAPLELFQPNESGHYAGNHPGSPITSVEGPPSPPKEGGGPPSPPPAGGGGGVAGAPQYSYENLPEERGTPPTGGTAKASETSETQGQPPAGGRKIAENIGYNDGAEENLTPREARQRFKQVLKDNPDITENMYGAYLRGVQQGVKSRSEGSRKR